MVDLENKYFDMLTRDRAESADMLEKPSMRGIRHSVVEKYSDQAHFIYELLQNADDAQATSARFTLEPTRLIFAHNGQRHFSVSNPETEESDSKQGLLGDINAITSIANSNKTEASIGKFGVGFKAVFQYTNTPHIYDPLTRFKIERFIVPKWLDEDFPGRCAEETLFAFPFDNPERTTNEAYEDIADKLQNLSFPLLFLSSLEEIELQMGDSVGRYAKSILDSHIFGDVTAEKILLTHDDGTNSQKDMLWLFSRTDSCERRYSVGFFLDEEGKLCPVQKPAFCFFPTKETTGLNFIIHAPFLLTDSREGILAGKSHNEDLIQALADLAAASLMYLKEIGKGESKRLIDDSLVDLIPYDERVFSRREDKSRISFLPFYETIHSTLKKEELIPTLSGYTSSENAYWAAVPTIARLISDEQLHDITENSAACWVFPSIGRTGLTQRSNPVLVKYIDSIVKTSINEETLLNGRPSERMVFGGRIAHQVGLSGITPSFIESQPIEWLHTFYKWISETKTRRNLVQKKRIFLNQKGQAAAAFDENDQPILFLPVTNIDPSQAIHSLLLENPDTKSFLREIGMREPSLRDQIYNNILPLYKTDVKVDATSHFKLFFDYYCDHCLNGDDQAFVDLIKNYEFLLSYKHGNDQPDLAVPSATYLPTPLLQAYFATKPNVRFVALEEYQKLAGRRQVQLDSFLTALGVKKTIGIRNVKVDPNTSERTDLPSRKSSKTPKITERIVDGCRELVEYILDHRDLEKSKVLWNALLSVIDDIAPKGASLSKLLRGSYRYFFRTARCASFDSSDALLLRNKPWLVNSDGIFVSPSQVTKQALSKDYDVSSDAAQALLDFLEIKDLDILAAEISAAHLTDEQRQKIEFADKYMTMGFTDSDFEELMRIKQQRESQRYEPQEQLEPQNKQQQAGSNPNKNGELNTKPKDEQTSSTKQSDSGNSSQREKEPSSERSRVVDDIVQRAQNDAERAPRNKATQAIDEAVEDVDADEFMPSLVDYQSRIERAKQDSAAQINQITHLEELQKRALDQPVYSFGWFKTLLTMESLSDNNAQSSSKQISISFGKAELEPGTKRTLVLKQPNRTIPQYVEDLADIPLILRMGDTKKTVVIEAANVKSFTLHVKLKKGSDLDDIDLSTVGAATIDAKSPAFLLDELRKQFEDLPFTDDYNMQENLCENIEFVFGPPGTGKTTHLATEEIHPLMSDENECRVLVLAPTNKAADVLTRRIMETAKDDSYRDWLVRFGSTADEEIEQSGVFRDKTLDIRMLPKSVTVTTMARFPYDYFMPRGQRLFLRDLKWDYIVIDEASMIPLAYATYALYKKTPKKFIIAGDPLQIEPITSIDLWRNENIYSLVQLNSFKEPTTIPHPYNVKLLATQYRSVPELGNVFSQFAYGGMLQHARTSESRKPLNLGNSTDISALNIIKFPVSAYESIYRAKRLRHSSSYQIYSAIFTYEYVSYLARSIAKSNPGQSIRIGIIAPYRAQADLIDRLLASEILPSEIDVQVGTIHGFQGDECDIVFAVFNTPPTISASKEMFLNKRNIINVSISRARDYLFVVMPDDDTADISNLQLVKRVERLIKDSDSWNETRTPELETLMFGEPGYLESNVFSTSHQSVNVYGIPEKYYEIRTEDNAVDIQIHRDAKKSDKNDSIE